MLSFVAKLRELVVGRMHGEVADAHVAETVNATVLAQVEAGVKAGAEQALQNLPAAIERGLEAALGKAFSAAAEEIPAPRKPKAKARRAEKVSEKARNRLLAPSANGQG